MLVPTHASPQANATGDLSASRPAWLPRLGHLSFAPSRASAAAEVREGRHRALMPYAIGNDPPRDINVIIEVPVGGEPIKYEMDKASGTLVVDRFLYTPMRYPETTDSCPQLSADGDPIDVLVCNTRAILPGAVINCRTVGVLVMRTRAAAMRRCWRCRAES